METINVDSKHIVPIIDNWQESVDNLKGSLLKMPAIKGGAISEETAHKWLVAAAKLYPGKTLEKLIQQQSGFGAKDIRTLIAHERNEYFPSDSVHELYSRKNLSTILAPHNPTIERERVLTNVARSIICTKYGLERDYVLEAAMAKRDPKRQAEWLIGNPGMVGVKNGETYIIDIQLENNNKELKQNELIKLHFYDLVANSIGHKPKHLNVIKIDIEPSLADSLVTIAKTSIGAEKALSMLALDFDNLPKDKMSLTTFEVEKQPALYQEILEVGQKHWSNLLRGEGPTIKEDPPLTLDTDREQTYIDKAKAFLAATQTVKAAEEHRQQTIDDFIQSMRGFDITDNFMPPYNGALLRKYDYFDAEAAATYLHEKLGVDDAHLRHQELNIERLKDAFVRMGGDLTPFYEYSKPDKKAVETAAEELGMDLTGFYSRHMKAIVNPKTRGPIHDSIKNIRSSAFEQVESISSRIASSPLMDDKNLYPADADTNSNTAQISMKV